MLSSMSSAASIYHCTVSFAHLQNRLLTYRCRQIKHSFPSDQSFFVIIFDLHIDNVHWLVEFSSSSQQVYRKMVRLGSQHIFDLHTIANRVKAPFLTCYHNVRHCSAILPSFRGKLQTSISIKHWQKAIGRITTRYQLVLAPT